MWTDATVPRYLILSALIGLAAFCFSYAVLIWQRRNRHTRAVQGVDQQRRMRGWSCTFALVGLSLMGLAYTVRVVVAVNGTLSGDGLLAVRALDNASPAFVAEVGRVEAGQVLARYDSADGQTRQKELAARLAQLVVERDALPLQPLAPDAELVRRHQNAVVAAREAQAALAALISPTTTSDRELTDQLFPKQQSLARVRNDINGSRKELEQARLRLATAIRQRDRERTLARSNFATLVSLDESAKEASTLEVEVARSQTRLSLLETEEKQTLAAIDAWEKLSTRQAAEFAREVERLRVQLALMNNEAALLEAGLKTDLERAAQARARDTERLSLKIRESEATLAGAAGRAAVQARFSGWVVYRHPSPGAVREKGILAVVSPHADLRLRARLPAGQVDALQAAGDMVLEIGDAGDARRFAGRFREAHALPAEPGVVLAELECMPPEDVVPLLVEGEKIKARFAWQPPLSTLWPFQVGQALALLGVAGFLMSSLFLRPLPGPGSNGPMPDPPSTRRQGDKENGRQGEKSEGAPRTTGLRLVPSEKEQARFIDTGEAGEVVEEVAIRFREAIRQGQVSEELVASAEWLLDRHLRAIMIFRRVLREDRDYLKPFNAGSSLTPKGASDWEAERDLIERVSRILKAAGIVAEPLDAAGKTRAA